MNKHDENYLRLMLEAAREAQSFAVGKSKNDLTENRMLLLALAKSIETVAPMASKVSNEGKGECRIIPWADIANAGGLLTNSYFYTNADVVWHTVTEELPTIIGELERLLPSIDAK
ncbi:MAG TPA: HepT-like ribonuclease domain-containing protein [Pyrinomonadaceae bacterium]|jgi:uncharacterized protein with HEPN domain|nr:HepT-like ribonuclease domain-containing protein [Pyrinomonadaceae bacterium]